MLKRKPRCARPRLQRYALPAAEAVPESVPVKASPWPEPQPQAERGVGKEAVWLCIALSALPLEALSADSATEATVVVAEQRQGRVVLACNPAATAQGVQPGMLINAAQALCPLLRVQARDAAAERAYLDALGDWALDWSSMVHVTDRAAVLLEVGGSVRLFGGLEALRQKLLSGLRTRRCAAVLACAPTPQAALWLGCAGQPACCLDRRGLPGLLGRLRLTELDWPAASVEKLRQMGITTLADCMRLPRDGFARRLGRDCLLELDQALGVAPQLLPRHREPEWFKAQESLPHETASTTIIEQYCARLVQQLGHFLRRRQAVVHQLLINLQHSNGTGSSVRIQLREPVAQPAYLLELLQLRLDQLVLPAPVLGLTLTAEALAAADTAAQFSTQALPGMAETDAAEQALRVRQLTERLRARLGKSRVHGLELVPEHRPERAWCRVEPRLTRRTATPTPRQPRPLWLLSQPRPVRIPAPPNRQVLERIETGWWDGNDVRRDYGTLHAADGSRWWVYRDRHDARWYLHGLFG